MQSTKRQLYTQGVLYGLPIIAQAILTSPILLLGGIYARDYGLSLSVIGSIMLFSRIFDAVTDPLIGGFSDYLYHKTGTRKLIITFGAGIYAISAWFLYVPLTNDVSATYFTIFFFAFYLGATMFNIPFLALASDIAKTAEKRSFFFSAYWVASQLGGLAFYVIPILGWSNSTEITPDLLKVATIVGIVLLVPSLWLALKYLPAGEAISHKVYKKSSPSIISATIYYIRSFIQNKLFCIYISIYMGQGLAIGCWSGLLFIFVDSYLGQGQAFASISLVSLSVGTVAALIAKLSIARLGSRNTWGLTICVTAVCFIITGLLTPASSSSLTLTILYSVQTACIVIYSVAGLTLLSSISDYGALNSGQENAAGYFAAMTLLAKLQIALGTSVGFFTIDWFGFVATGSNAIQSADGVWGMKLAISLFPTIFAVIALLLLFRLPLNKRQIKTISRAIERRRNRIIKNDAQQGDL